MDDGCIIYGCLILAFIVFSVSITPYLFMLLWNWLMPMLFNIPTITFWESFGIILLLGIVGSFFKSSNSK